jgi:PAS domain S-box-containing protein
VTAPAISAELLAEILDFSPVGVAISTFENSIVVYANPVMAAFFGMTQAEILGKDVVSFFADPKDQKRSRAALKQRGEVLRFPLRYMTASGVEGSSLISSRLITYNGTPSVLTWLEDETERTQREHAILSASKQVELLHNVAGIGNRAVNFYDALRKATAEIAQRIGWPVGLAYRVAHGDDELLELSSLSMPKDNAAYDKLRSELIGRSFRSGEDMPGRVLASKEIEWIADVSKDPDLSRFSHDRLAIKSALGIPIIAEDRVVAVLEFLTDQPSVRDDMLVLTLAQVSSELGRVLLRDQMTMTLQEARAEAESSARAKASFLAAMSHEVRTPMNGVIGMVDLVLQTKLDDDQRFMLQTVRDSGEALITVINDILDFSKIEAGRLEIENAEFSIAKAIEDVALSLAPMTSKKDLTLVTAIDPDLPDVVMGDSVRLRQILSNLGSNAVKFSERGEIVLKAELKRGDDDSALQVIFTVRDEGIGISAEARERLFEEFQQADTSTTRRFGGTGLGLAICYRLTRLMGGEISVDSLLGVGSEFHCVLPFTPAERRSTERPTSDLAGLRILVISESDEQREAARRYLEFWKAVVEPATRLRDCLQLFQAAKKKGRPFDIIVIPQAGQTLHVTALRQAFTDAGLVPYPRFVVGRDNRTDSEELLKIKEVTLVETSPLRRAALLKAVAVAAGRASPETDIVPQPDLAPVVAAPSVEEALAAGRLILVAEDHRSNQEVIRRQLNRLGYACEMAEDGAVALKMWQSKKYALLLTDCHMPNMDGFGLTAEIRKAEERSGFHAPIIAITANVLQGEAERCLAAGMDAFLPKPVDLKTLGAALEKWIDGVEIVDRKAIYAPNSETPPVLDLAQMEEIFGGIDDSVREIFGVFIESVEPLLDEFQTALTAANHSQAREIIHKAKGAAANAGGRELAALMGEIEVALVERRYDDAELKGRGIEPAWQRLTQAIAQI